MKLLEKKITPANYAKCFTCATYQAAILPILHKAYPKKSQKELMMICPNCMWFIEHVLNGNEKDTKNCIWHLSTHQPAPISQ